MKVMVSEVESVRLFVPLFFKDVAGPSAKAFTFMVVAFFTEASLVEES